jgi:hypothetical protein
MTGAGTPRPFCILGWLLLILVPSLVIAAVAVPVVVRLDRLETAIEERRDQILKYRRLIATLPTCGRSLSRSGPMRTSRPSTSTPRPPPWPVRSSSARCRTS